MMEKILSKVKTQENQVVVQENVTRAEDWAEIWDMLYNKDKCHHLHVGSYTPVGSYTMREDETSAEIKKVDYEKDLDIIVDKNCTSENI